jgi:hypothetical protein
MRLSAAARFFDRTLFKDAFVPTTTFRGQFDLYDDSKRDGITVARRVLSVAPDVAIPARRVVVAEGENWIVGAVQLDHYNGAPVRAKYVIQRANGAATIRTVAQALSAGGTATYASRLWVKDVKEVDVSSLLNPFYNVYLPSPEALVVGQLIELSGRQHLVRGFYPSAAGLLVAEAAELPLSAIAVGTYKAMTLDVVADDRTLSSSTALNLLKLRFQDLFAYREQAQPTFREGDVRALIRKADVPTAKVNDLLNFGGEDWEILTVSDEDAGLCWGLHLRHAGN